MSVSQAPGTQSHESPPSPADQDLRRAWIWVALFWAILTAAGLLALT